MDELSGVEVVKYLTCVRRDPFIHGGMDFVQLSMNAGYATCIGLV